MTASTSATAATVVVAAAAAGTTMSTNANTSSNLKRKAGGAAGGSIASPRSATSSMSSTSASSASSPVTPSGRASPADLAASRARSYYSKLRSEQNSVIGHVRAVLAPWVASGDGTIAAFQRACGVTQAAGRGWLPLHLLFTFGAALGNELFFVIAMPQMFWVIDPVIGRRVMLLWAFLYYVGQGLKDVIKLPRPAPRNGIVRLESHYLAEYGMPSTHAMNASSMPFYLCFLMIQRWDMDPALPLACALVWWFSTTFSRLYMGVHSPADVIAGCALGFGSMLVMTIVGDAIDNFVATSTALWWQAPLVGAVLAYLYPHPKHWVNSPGDTALILGATVGAVVGVNALPADKQSYVPFPVSAIPDKLWIIPAMVGCLLFMILIRAVCKAVVPAVVGLFTDVGPDPKHNYTVELPTKFVTYFLMGMWACCGVAVVF